MSIENILKGYFNFIALRHATIPLNQEQDGKSL
jgi:hypothetical protein